MFESTVLEIIIVLVFIFLIYSLLATIVVEIIASILRLRARSFRWGVIRMLQDSQAEKNLIGAYFNNIFMGIKKLFFKSAYEKQLVEKFFESPSIKYLAKGATSSTPSYLEPSVFSKTLLDILKKEEGVNDLESIKNALEYSEDINSKITVMAEEWEEFKSNYESELDPDRKTALMAEWLGQFEKKPEKKAFDFTPLELQQQMAKINGTDDSQKKFKILTDWENNPNATLEIDLETRLHLCSLLKDSNENLEDFKLSLEDWFNHTMDRVKGWYKRKISGITFFVGLFLAVSFNVDTIYIVKELKTNTAARKALIVQAETFVNTHENVDEANLLKEEVQSVAGEINESLSLSSHCTNYGKNPWSAIFGWLLTAIAISFGAPFWFDLLNKLMQLRSTLQVKTGAPKETEVSSTSAKGTGSTPAKRKRAGKIYG